MLQNTLKERELRSDVILDCDPACFGLATLAFLPCFMLQFKAPGRSTRSVALAAAPRAVPVIR